MALHIPLAWYGSVTIEKFVEFLYQNNLVQRLRFLFQLAEKIFDFPSATQNRLAHSLRVYNDTKELPENIIKNFDSDTKKALAAFALAHDVPHCPLSHTLEPFFGDHDNAAIDIIEQLKYSVELDGIDFEMFKGLMLHEKPEYKIVSDKNFGTDKLDYLKYDPLHCGAGNIIDTNFLRQHLHFENGQIMAQIEAIEETKELQKKYLDAYQSLYCSAQAMTWQRLSQKITQYCFFDGVFLAKEIRWWNDFEFWGRVAFVPLYHVQEMYQITKCARIPKTAIEFLPEDQIVKSNPYQHVLPEEFFTRIPDWKTMQATFNMETRIADLSGLESWRILLVSQDQPKKRFIPTDCKIIDNKGNISSLFELAPEHLASMQKAARKSMFIRIAVIEKDGNETEKLRKATEAIQSYLECCIGKILEAKK